MPPLQRCELRLETVVVCPARSENRVRERVRAQRPRQPRRRSGLLIISATSALSPPLPELLPLFFPTTQSARQQRPACRCTFFFCLCPMASDCCGSFGTASAGTRYMYMYMYMYIYIYMYIYKIEFDQVDGFCMSFAKRKITGLGCCFVCGKCLLLRSTVPSFVF